MAGVKKSVFYLWGESGEGGEGRCDWVAGESGEGRCTGCAEQLSQVWGLHFPSGQSCLLRFAPGVSARSHMLIPNPAPHPPNGGCKYPSEVCAHLSRAPRGGHASHPWLHPSSPWFVFGIYTLGFPPTTRGAPSLYGHCVTSEMQLRHRFAH